MFSFSCVSSLQCKVSLTNDFRMFKWWTTPPHTPTLWHSGKYNCFWPHDHCTFSSNWSCWHLYRAFTQEYFQIVNHHGFLFNELFIIARANHTSACFGGISWAYRLPTLWLRRVHGPYMAVRGVMGQLGPWGYFCHPVTFLNSTVFLYVNLENQNVLCMFYPTFSRAP